MGSKGNLGVRGSGGEGKEKVEGGRLRQRKGREEARGRRVRVKEGERRGEILFFRSVEYLRVPLIITFPVDIRAKL